MNINRFKPERIEPADVYVESSPRHLRTASYVKASKPELNGLRFQIAFYYSVSSPRFWTMVVSLRCAVDRQIVYATHQCGWRLLIMIRPAGFS